MNLESWGDLALLAAAQAMHDERWTTAEAGCQAQVSDGGEWTKAGSHLRRLYLG